MRTVIKNFLKIFMPVIFGIFITALSLAILQPYMATKYQVYKDIIIGNDLTAKGINKSGELTAIWGSLFFGIISVFGFKYFWEKKSILSGLEKEDVRLDFLGIGIFLISSIYVLIFKQEINFYLLFLGLVYYISYIFTDRNPEKSGKILLLLFSIYISMLSLKAVCDKIIRKKEIIRSDIVIILTVLIFIFILYIIRRNIFKKIDKIILMLQIPSPFILLSYLTNRYLYKGEIIKIQFPKLYRLLIIFIMMALMIYNIYVYINRNKDNRKKEIIMYSSVLIMFILHSYSSPALTHNGDFWHIAEEILPWHQLVNKQMNLYINYNGSSGLFGLATGFFLNIFLQGKDLYYTAAHALTNIFWAGMIGTLCYYLVGSKFALMLAMFINIPDYNRGHFLFVSVLILMLPKLFNSRVRWLQIYFILSFFAIFYYPVNGIILICALFPSAMIQVYRVYKEKLLKKEIKKILFWGANIIILYIIIGLNKYVFGWLKYVLLMSSYTKIIEGINVYRTSIPSKWFLIFVESETLRTNLWYIFVLTMILSTVIISWYLFYIYIFDKRINIIKKIKKPSFTLISAISIILIMSFQFTLIRMNPTDELTKRNVSVILFNVGFLLNIFIYRYSGKLFSRNQKIVLIGFLIGFISVIQGILAGYMPNYSIRGNTIGKEVNMIQNKYIVSEDYTYINNKNNMNLNRLGEGFIKTSELEVLKIVKENVDKFMMNTDDNFWINRHRELVSIFDKKVPAKIETIYLTPSLKSTKENIEIIEKEPPIFISDFKPMQSYYMFRWIIDKGYIRYTDKNYEFWIHPDRYEKVFGNLKEEKEKMIEEWALQDMGEIPSSFGNSMRTLDKLFSDRKIVYPDKLKIEGNQVEILKNKRLKILGTDSFIWIKLPENIKGNDYDFVYMKLKSNKKNKYNMQLSWDENKENKSVRLTDTNGNLLIPLGFHLSWLYSETDKIKISFKDIEIGREIEINEIIFMKLNRK